MLQHALWAHRICVCQEYKRFVCLRKKNDSKCNAKIHTKKKLVLWVRKVWVRERERQGHREKEKERLKDVRARARDRDLNVLWMEFIRVSSNKWSKNQDLCTFIIKFSRLARLFFVTFSNEMQLFSRQMIHLIIVCLLLFVVCACEHKRCLGIYICILIVSSVFSVCVFLFCFVAKMFICISPSHNSPISTSYSSMSVLLCEYAIFFRSISTFSTAFEEKEKKINNKHIE